MIDARATEIQIDIDGSGGGERFVPFWCSTGFTPAELLLDPVMKQTVAYLGALPLRGNRYVRIHYLLNLVRVTRVTESGPVYDWSLLDHGLDVLVRNRQVPIFELMGNPSDHFTGFEDAAMLHGWRALVRELATRCIARYGRDEVVQWYFETWNEPDIQYWRHGDSAFLNYYDACSEGLKDADPALRFGGPGSARTLSSTFKALVAHCDHGINWFTGERGVRVDFFSVHEKAAVASPEDLTPDLPMMCDREEAAISYIREHHPRLADVPFMNDESDPQVGWSDFHTWHGKPYYAALVCRMIDQHQARLVEGLQVPYALLGNDNGFLGGWGQRSQLALFADKALARAQAEHRTVLPDGIPPATFTGDGFALIRKPVLNVMALLAYLDGERCPVRFSAADAELGAIATRSADGQVAVLVHHGSDRLDRSGSAPLRLRLDRMGTAPLCLAEYRIAAGHNDPFAAWERLGHPRRPDNGQLSTLRRHHEVELLAEPRQVAPHGGVVELDFDMPMPGVHLLLLTPDNGEAIEAPGRLRAERYRGLNGEDDVMLIWDATARRSLRSYEVFCANRPDGSFERINPTDLLHACFLHARAPAHGADSRHYRVRAVDFWGRPGPFSETIPA